MMVSAWPHSLAYDPLGRLIHIDTATGIDRFGYDGASLIVEYDGGNNVARRYVHGPGEPLVWYEGSGTTDRRWLHADERGSVIAVSDGSGSVTNVNAYDEYGIPGVANSGRFQYTGQAWIPGVGMYYYRARFYSPTWGRFVQTDPIGYEDGMNLYAYVGNDPVNYTDPLGLQRICRDATTGVGSNVTVHSRCSPFNLNLLQDFANRGFGSHTQADARDWDLAGQIRDATRFRPRERVVEPGICPAVPASRPIGNTGRWGAALRDSLGAIMARDIGQQARQATATRFPARTGGDGDIGNAYQHFYWVYGMTRVLGADRARFFANANEVSGNNPARFLNTDTWNNETAIRMATDPRNRGRPTADVAEEAMRNGCLRAFQ